MGYKSERERDRQRERFKLELTFKYQLLCLWRDREQELLGKHELKFNVREKREWGVGEINFEAGQI